MDLYGKLGVLIDLAEELGIAVRQGPAGADADAPGGALVRLRGRAILFLNPAATPADQLDAVAAALRGRAELESRYLPPEIRTLIDPEA